MWDCTRNPRGRPRTSNSTSSPPVSSAVLISCTRQPSGSISSTSPALAIALALQVRLDCDPIRSGGANGSAFRGIYRAHGDPALRHASEALGVDRLAEQADHLGAAQQGDVLPCPGGAQAPVPASERRGQPVGEGRQGGRLDGKGASPSLD